ncbi:ABC transporter transmembrane region [Marinitoga hydrogenitolerans DSM 16785]|uniref:ABC transporter transmembrane region n=1 Tax=Marinitoga hydrogenitolerans (strain DSM 16785 / JCM 12826 / AT1271) TaxID=1122195 RepID=A0A1M5AR94_MARH1|nr:ABC transporter transmembrane domain-containing protein [Marinitoga hydrogenitolerans]SHF32705.1 ABC transporter transmembrane region [Marinitoga hydrogenitolerans DSM 16785]
MKKTVFIILLFSIVSITLEYFNALIPYYTKNFLNTLSTGIIDNTILMKIFAIIISVLIIKNIVSMFLGYYSKKLSYSITEKGIYNLLNFDYMEFRKNNETYYAESLLRLPQQIIEVLNSSGVESIAVVFKLIFLIIFIFKIDINTGIATIFYILISTFNIYISNNYFYNNYDKQVEINLKNISDTSDQLEGLKEIHFFKNVKNEIKRFNERNDKYKNFSIKINIMDWILSFTISDFFQFSIYIYSIYRGLILKDIGSLLALYMYIKNVTNIMNNSLFGMWNSLRDALIAWNKLKNMVFFQNKWVKKEKI